MLRALVMAALCMSACPAWGQVFEVTTPPISAYTGGRLFELTTQPLTASAGGRVFEVITPAITAYRGGRVFEITTPAVTAYRGGCVFEVTTEPVSAFAGGRVFEVETPVITALAALNTPSDAYVPCQHLTQCFSRGDVETAFKDLTSLGYDPNDAALCQWVAQSLGPCPGPIPSSTAVKVPAASLSELVPGVPLEEGALSQCPPIRGYLEDLQRRGNEGQDIEPDAMRYAAATSAALPSYLSGDFEGWCSQVVARLK